MCELTTELGKETDTGTSLSKFTREKVGGVAQAQMLCDLAFSLYKTGQSLTCPR